MSGVGRCRRFWVCMSCGLLQLLGRVLTVERGHMIFSVGGGVTSGVL